MSIRSKVRAQTGPFFITSVNAGRSTVRKLASRSRGRCGGVLTVCWRWDTMSRRCVLSVSQPSESHASVRGATARSSRTLASPRRMASIPFRFLELRLTDPVRVGGPSRFLKRTCNLASFDSTRPLMLPVNRLPRKKFLLPDFSTSSLSRSNISSMSFLYSLTSSILPPTRKRSLNCFLGTISC